MRGKQPGSEGGPEANGRAAEAFEEAGDRFRTMVNALPDIVILKDGEGRWLEANRTALNCFDNCCGPENERNELFPACGDSDEEAWRTGKTVHCEQVVRKPDGTVLFFRVSKIPLFYPDGRRKGLVVVGRDVTECKRSAGESQLVAKVFDNLTEGVIITDEKGTILSVNPAFTAVTGYSAEEAKGKNPRILKSGRQDAAFYQNMWASLQKTGQWRGEIWNRRKNGDIYPEWLTINSITDQSGNITHYIGVFNDITERKQLERDAILAGRVQKRSLPPDITDERITVKTVYRPAYYLSGDAYEFRWSQNGDTLSGCVIDVMGHGLAPALQNSVLKVLFCEAVDLHLPTDRALAWLNRKAIAYFAEDSYAAMICFEIDLKRRTLACAAGGINYFLASSSQGQTLVKVPGTFVGMFRDAAYEKYVLPYQPGDCFYFLSDGLLDLLPRRNVRTGTDFEATVCMLQKLSEKANDDATAVCIKLG